MGGLPSIQGSSRRVIYILPIFPPFAPSHAASVSEISKQKAQPISGSQHGNSPASFWPVYQAQKERDPGSTSYGRPYRANSGGRTGSYVRQAMIGLESRHATCRTNAKAVPRILMSVTLWRSESGGPARARFGSRLKLGACQQTAMRACPPDLEHDQFQTFYPDFYAYGSLDLSAVARDIPHTAPCCGSAQRP